MLNPRPHIPNPTHKQVLVDSFAPSIFEMEDVKKGLLCQLFGGSNFSKLVPPRPPKQCSIAA